MTKCDNDYFRMGAAIAVGELYDMAAFKEVLCDEGEVRSYLGSFGVHGLDDVDAERKGLYRDIETLREFGMDIRQLKHQPVQYALAERDFEPSQLTLLVDAVQSSRFLSDGASKALVKSVRQKLTRHRARKPVAARKAGGGRARWDGLVIRQYDKWKPMRLV